MIASTDIIASGWKAIAGSLPNIPPAPGLCLALVRVVIENAFGWPSHTWYAKWLKEPAPDKPIDQRSVPWARDMERSLRAAGMEVSGERYGPRSDPTRYAKSHSAMPGDLLFKWDSAKHSSGAYIGHVGIMMPGRLVLENINPNYRNSSSGVWRGPTRLGPVDEWPITTIIRFNPRGR